MLLGKKNLDVNNQAVFSPLNVQSPFNAPNRRAISNGRYFWQLNRHALNAFLASNRCSMRGRIGEVGPPASGRSFFTLPYSHLSVLNANPALREQRLIPAGAHHEW
jgi:hypothetical protein